MSRIHYWASLRTLRIPIFDKCKMLTPACVHPPTPVCHSSFHYLPCRAKQTALGLVFLGAEQSRPESINVRIWERSRIEVELNFGKIPQKINFINFIIILYLNHCRSWSVVAIVPWHGFSLRPLSRVCDILDRKTLITTESRVFGAVEHDAFSFIFFRAPNAGCDCTANDANEKRCNFSRSLPIPRSSFCRRKLMKCSLADNENDE